MFNYIVKSFSRLVDQPVIATKVAYNFARTQEIARDENKIIAIKQHPLGHAY
jgi:hypothetical protein